MHRLILITATTALAFLLLAPPAWADWVWPLRGEVITPYRNGNDPYAAGQHRGIDIAGAVGTPVVAAAGGEVRFAGNVGASGLTVSIRTADGGFDTSYLHLSSIAVREGDRIAGGERVGAVGTTGVRSAAAPHLHFGVREAGSRHAYLDPLGLLPPAPTATESPRAAPAPQPAPVTAAPAPAPVEAPAARPVPVGAPAPRRVPFGAPAPRRLPRGAPSPHRVLAPSLSPRSVPVHAPSDHPVRVGAPAHRPVPDGAPEPRSVPVQAPSGREAPHRVHPVDPTRARARTRRGVPEPPTRPAARASGFGPDIGLVLACLGLLAAAALLGLTNEGQRASRRTGQRLARALQPMLGRR